MSGKVAFFLSGSGHLDGTEITEATTLIIALSKYAINVDFFAPDYNQADVVNHISHKAITETRNIMEESARITRGNIQPTSHFDAKNYDAVVLPGGFGAIKNLTNFLTEGSNATLNDDMDKALSDAIKYKLWIVGICAAPLIIALALKNADLHNASITFGQSDNAGNFLPAIQEWKIEHVETKIQEIHVDSEHKLVTSGAYMFHDASPYDIYLTSDVAIKTLSDKLI